MCKGYKKSRTLAEIIQGAILLRFRPVGIAGTWHKKLEQSAYEGSGEVAYLERQVNCYLHCQLFPEVTLPEAQLCIHSFNVLLIASDLGPRVQRLPQSRFVLERLRAGVPPLRLDSRVSTHTYTYGSTLLEWRSWRLLHVSGGLFLHQFCNFRVPPAYPIRSL